jgi:hypothetical protein
MMRGYLTLSVLLLGVSPVAAVTVDMIAYVDETYVNFNDHTQDYHRDYVSTAVWSGDADTATFGAPGIDLTATRGGAPFCGLDPCWALNGMPRAFFHLPSVIGHETEYWQGAPGFVTWSSSHSHEAAFGFTQHDELDTSGTAVLPPLAIAEPTPLLLLTAGLAMAAVTMRRRDLVG